VKYAGYKKIIVNAKYLKCMSENRWVINNVAVGIESYFL
jgi:hypothetical protein